MKVVNDHVQQEKRSFMTVEIGLSNSRCRKCEDFLDWIQKSHPKLTIVVSTDFERVGVAGWRRSPLTRPDILRGAQEHAKGTVDDYSSPEKPAEYPVPPASAYPVSFGPIMAMLGIALPRHTLAMQNLSHQKPPSVSQSHGFQ
jgi:hypothetical protein